MNPTSRDVAEAHLGACGSNHSKACDMLTIELANVFSDLHMAKFLLGNWMFWASGVAFKSEYGEQLEKDTDKFLGIARSAHGARGAG